MQRTAAVAVLAWIVAGCVTADQERVRDYNEDGVHLFEKGDFVHAGECFQAALALKPGDADLTYNLGQAYDRQGKMTRAEQTYNDCLTRAPNHAACRHALCVLLVRQGRRAEAVRMVEEWLAQEPGRSDPYAEDGWLWHQAGDLPRAQARLQQALERDPHNSRALNELALVYEDLHYPDRAVTLYEQSLENNPKQPDVFQRVSRLRTQGAGRPKPE
jgi:Flp pilus assembly protein TadD